MTTIDWSPKCSIITMCFPGAPLLRTNGEGWERSERMAPRVETRNSEAANVKGGPPTAHLHRTEEPSAALEDISARAILKEAQDLLMQVLSILNDPICEKHPSAGWSFKLARAHALTLLDHLARMMDPQRR
jgi:hypothetical protein